MVRQFLRDEERFHRYYVAVIWHRRLLEYPCLGHSVVVMRDALAKDNNPLYWWYARNFLVLAHATGRDDLLSDVETDELRPRFDEWLKWFAKNGAFLRARTDYPGWHVDEGEKRRQEGFIPFLDDAQLPCLVKFPECPFPDWEGPPPPTPKNFHDMAHIGPVMPKGQEGPLWSRNRIRDRGRCWPCEWGGVAAAHVTKERRVMQGI